MKFALPLLLAAAFLFGCAEGPEARYAGPSGEGVLVYDPEVGITRRGAEPVRDEQDLYTALDAAHGERRWEDVIRFSLAISDAYPEGSRIVDALIKRIEARLEAGRNPDPDEGLPNSIRVTDWLYLYLAPDHSGRLQQLMRDGANAEYINELRGMDVDRFIDGFEADAEHLYDSGQLELALADVRTLLTYYLPALEITRYRHRAAELGRDVAWLMYAADDNGGVIDVSADLQAMSPPPAVKADTLFILGHAQRRNGAHALAADTFGRLYRGAGLSDTDTRWRPYALLQQIHQTIESSKGFIYDQTPYEAALELLGEYELYMIENPNIADDLHEQFIVLMEDVYNVFIRRDLNAAETYGRVGESGAREYYLERAEDWEEERDQRTDELREAR